MPAFCSPLNGVTIFCGAPGSQPRLNGTLGSLNHTPRWYWWAGANVVVPPGDTENVSASKMPLTVALPNPLSLVWMSLWYHETPNGAVGCWITNRSNPVLGGMPCRLTFMVSFSDPVVMVACPPAFGRHAEMAGDDGFSPNENDDADAGRAGAPPVAAPAVAVRLSAAAKAPAATTVTAFAAVGARMLRIVGRVLLMTGPPVTRRRPPPPVLLTARRAPGRGQLGRGTRANARMVQFGDGDLCAGRRRGRPGRRRRQRRGPAHRRGRRRPDGHRALSPVPGSLIVVCAPSYRRRPAAGRGRRPGDDGPGVA